MERMHSIFDHVLRKIYYPPTMPHQRFNRHSPKKPYSLWRGMSNKILFIIHFSDYLECYFKYLQFSFRIPSITIAAPSYNSKLEINSVFTLIQVSIEFGFNFKIFPEIFQKTSSTADSK